jgi:hypothetical protein
MQKVDLFCLETWVILVLETSSIKILYKSTIIDLRYVYIHKPQIIKHMEIVEEVLGS